MSDVIETESPSSVLADVENAFTACPLLPLVEPYRSIETVNRLQS